MDYYQILKIPPNASKKEIDDAFKRLMKESRYNAQLNRREIEAAFKILSDAVARKAYDSKKDERSKIDAAVDRVHKRRQRHRAKKARFHTTLRQKIILLLLMIPLAIVFYSFRFGHYMKEFQPGDVIYYKYSNQLLGTIISAERDHDFGSGRSDAYLIEWNSTKKQDWIPAVNIKSSCYKIDDKAKPPKK